MVLFQMETALKQSAMVHERDMCQLKDTLQLKDTQTINMMTQMVILIHNICQYEYYSSFHTVNLVFFGFISCQNVLIQNAETYEREMRQWKDIIQQKDRLTMEMMEKMVTSYLKLCKLEYLSFTAYYQNIYLSLHTNNLIYFGYLSDGKCIKTE